MAAVAMKLAESALSQLVSYAAENIKPAINKQLGIETTTELLKKVKQELDEVKRGQQIINQKLDSITVELKLGFKLTQFIEAEAKILSRMISFGDAMEGAIADGNGKTLGDNKQLQSVLTAIAAEIDGMRDQLHFVQDALLSRQNPQKESLIDVVNAYFWNKYGGAHGLSAEGVAYGIPSYVKDIQGYFKSIAQLQLTAIYLISWAVDPNVLRVEAKRAITLLEDQAKAISDFVPSGIDITDINGKGDAFFRQVAGNDDCFMIREAHGEKNFLVLRTVTGYAYPPWSFVGLAPWKGNMMTPMDYRWKLEPVDDVEGYKLVGWDINGRNNNEPRTVQWEKDASDRHASTGNRYTTRNKGKDVVFKVIVVKSSTDSSYTTVRLMDTEVAHGTDGQTPKWFDNRAKEPYTFELVYQNGQRYNTSFRDSTSGF